MELNAITSRTLLCAITLENFQPFRLMINSEEFLGEQLMRLIPNKRIVVKGHWRQQRVIVKLFFNKAKAQWHCARECRGYEWAQQQQFHLPKVYFAGELSVSGVYAVVYEALYPLKHFNQIESNPEKASEWLVKVQRLIAQMHQKGLMQKDMHPDNFVWVNDDIYLLDYASIKRESDIKQQLDNMALFYAQLPIKMQMSIKVLFSEYCTLRQWRDVIALEPELLERVKEWRFERGEQWIEKSLRNCSAFVAARSRTQRFSYVRAAHSEALLQFLHNPESFLKKHEVQLLKNGNTSTVFRVNMDNQWYIVKRYNVKNVKHFLTHFWRKSRAERSWQMANFLNLFQIASPKPIAYLEQRQSGLRKLSYFLMTEVGDETLQQRCLTGCTPELIDTTAKLIAQLARLQIKHGDMKATNFVVKEDQVFIVDFDAMRPCRDEVKWRSAFQKDLRRFRKNWRHNPDVLKAFDRAIQNHLS